MRLFPLLAALAWLLAAGVQAAEPAAAAGSLGDRIVEKRSVAVEGRALGYRSIVGSLSVADPPSAQAKVVFFAYELEGADTSKRPIAFAFNGGPGAASAYLHIGAMGPRRVALNDDGTLPTPPARLVDNDLSWLAFTDLVFVDPLGTGFSRNPKGDDKDSDSSFWGVREDAEALSRFIRSYLTRSGRWQSPKYLVGESYGGFRAAILSDLLPSSYGVALNGAILISPALQFAITRPDGYDVIPAALKLPSLTAVAMLHGKSNLAVPAGGLDRAALAPVENWSLDSYLTGLARGAALPAPARDALIGQAAALTGMPAELVRRNNGRIGNSDFAKTLLRGTGRLPSLYDGAMTVVDPDPESSNLDRDTGLDQLNAVLVPAFNAYARDELKYETDQPYLLLNGEVNGQWRWRGGRGQGYAGAADRLKNGMAMNPRLKVLIAHGLYDIVTPYFASAYVIDQMHLSDEQRANLTFKAYAAGHMVYTHRDARAALYRDAKAVFEAGAP